MSDKLAEASKAYQAAVEHLRSAYDLSQEMIRQLEEDAGKAKLELDRAWFAEHGVEWL